MCIIAQRAVVPICELRLFALAAFFVVSLRAAETYQPYRSDLNKGHAYTIDARRLHPTQFSLGLREVDAKRKAIEGMNAAELVGYLKEKDVPLVIGPGGVPYMIDGHHTIRAVLESNQPGKTVYGHVLANWSKHNEEEFWGAMQEHHYTYLNDSYGRGPHNPRQLPATLAAMQHDVYRGLAWAVMKAGGFKEMKGVFFQEFLWADYFRDKVTWDDTNEKDFARAVEEAVACARRDEAARLPGFVGRVK